MRKAVVMMALMALLTLAVAGMAYADRITGNDRANTLFETRRNDTIYGFGGGDVIDANNFSGETDRGYGNAGNDRILVNDNDRLDAAVGGSGYDICVVDRRIEIGTGCDKVRIR
jgi:Ca2+-binding RTX toxin-like protein